MPRCGVGKLAAFPPLPEVPEVPEFELFELPVPLEVEPPDWELLPVALFDPPEDAPELLLELPEGFELVPPGKLPARPVLPLVLPAEFPVELLEGLELVPPGRLPAELPFASPLELPVAPLFWPLEALPAGLPPEVALPFEAPVAPLVALPETAEPVPPPFWSEPGVRETGVSAPAVMVPGSAELLPSPFRKLPDTPAWAFAVAVAWVLETVFLLPNAPVSMARIRTTSKTRKKRRTACKVRCCLALEDGFPLVPWGVAGSIGISFATDKSRPGEK